MDTLNLNSLHLIQERKRFVLGGKAIFTVLSTSGTRYTFKVKKKDDFYFVSYLYGKNNESDYRYIGFIVRDEFRVGNTKSEQMSKVFHWIWKHIDSNQMQFFHSCKCGRCGRQLTTVESVLAGFGPECIHLV